MASEVQERLKRFNEAHNAYVTLDECREGVNLIMLKDHDYVIREFDADNLDQTLEEMLCNLNK